MNRAGRVCGCARIETTDVRADTADIYMGNHFTCVCHELSSHQTGKIKCVSKVCGRKCVCEKCVCEGVLVVCV